MATEALNCSSPTEHHTIHNTILNRSLTRCPTSLRPLSTPPSSRSEPSSRVDSPASCDTVPRLTPISFIFLCASPGWRRRSRLPRRYSRICRHSRRHSRRYSPHPLMRPPSRYAACTSNAEHLLATHIQSSFPRCAPHPALCLRGSRSPPTFLVHGPTYSTRRRGFTSSPAPGSCTCRQPTARLVPRPLPGAAPACAAVVAALALAREVALPAVRRAVALAVVMAAEGAMHRYDSRRVRRGCACRCSPPLWRVSRALVLHPLPLTAGEDFVQRGFRL